MTTTQEVGAAVGFAAMIAVAASVTGDLQSHDATAGGYSAAIFAGAVIAAAGAVLSALTPRHRGGTESRASDYGKRCADGLVARAGARRRPGVGMIDPIPAAKRP